MSWALDFCGSANIKTIFLIEKKGKKLPLNAGQGIWSKPNSLLCDMIKYQNKWCVCACTSMCISNCNDLVMSDILKTGWLWRSEGHSAASSLDPQALPLLSDEDRHLMWVKSIEFTYYFCKVQNVFSFFVRQIKQLYSPAISEFIFQLNIWILSTYKHDGCTWGNCACTAGRQLMWSCGSGDATTPNRSKEIFCIDGSRARLQTNNHRLTEIADRAQEEVNRYMDVKPVPLCENPLTWKRERAGEYRLSACQAKWYICLPRTSVASEKVFSTV